MQQRDDATMPKNSDNANDDAGAGEHDVDKEEVKEDGGGRCRVADHQIRRPYPRRTPKGRSNHPPNPPPGRGRRRAMSPWALRYCL